MLLHDTRLRSSCPWLLAGLVCCASLAVGLSGCNSANSSSNDAGPPAVELKTADEVLQAMVEAYRKAPSYSDQGVARITVKTAAEQKSDQANFAVQFVRPNKLHVDVYQAKVACDGRQLRATLGELPQQFLVRDVPGELTLNALYADPMLLSGMTQGFAAASLQLLLLFEKDPLRILVAQGEKPSLGEPGEIDGRKFYRVTSRGPDGATVFWIDQQTLVLRRLEYPTDGVRATDPTIKEMSLVADFVGAQLGGKVDDAAFALASPPGVETVPYFLAPNPFQLLGRPIPSLRFADLEGKPLTHEAFAGKTTALFFWSTLSPNSRRQLANLDKLYQANKDNDKVAIVAVSADGPEIDNKATAKWLQDAGVALPVVRDSEGDGGQKLFVPQSLGLLLIDAQGILQDFDDRSTFDLLAELPPRIAKLAAGENLYPTRLEEYKRVLKRHGEMIDRASRGEESGQPQEVPAAQIAPRSEPKSLKIASLWRLADVTSPGNIVGVPQAGGPPRLAVVEAFKGIAEVGLDGKVLARHALPIDESEVVTTLRTAVGADGRRYYLAFFNNQQRVHLLDANFKLLLSYPPDALQNRHEGIAEAQLADLDGDGVLEMYVGYWGVVGVQQVSLEGKRLNANRQIASVQRIAIGPPGQGGQRSLYCITHTGTVAVLDARLQRVADVVVQNRPLHSVFAADLGNGWQWLGLSSPQLGSNLAVGFDAAGRETFSYTLPEGVPPQPIEPVAVGRLSGAAPQWILPGADGSIHVLSAAGHPVEQFNYGAALSGLAVVEADGRPLLVVATPQGVEAWRVE